MSVASSKKRYSWIVSILLVCTSLAVTLVLAEAALRLFYPQRLYYNISQWDPYVGFTLIPGIQARSKHQDYIMHMRINSHGLRDREFPYEKPADTVRIGVFGDSFTFGEGVQNQEAYPKILERLFNQNEQITKMGSTVEVLNFGIGKTGTSHQLAWYQKEGHKYDLDFVILGFLGGNDFSDNVKGVFYLDGDQLVHDPAAYTSIRRIQKIVYRIPFYQWLANNSHMINLLRKAATLANDRMRYKRSLSSKVPGNQNKEPRKLDGYQLTLRLVEEFGNQVTESGARFMMMSLPGKHQKPLEDYAPETHVRANFIRSDALIREVRKQNIDVLDLVPVFADLPVSKYYFEHDGHMTKLGHELVASNLYEWILPEVTTQLQRPLQN